MTAEEPDHQNTGTVLQDSYQPIVVAFDIEDHPASFQDARAGMRGLHVLRIVPGRALRNSKPHIVLRLCCPNSLVAGMDRKIAFDGIGADDDHRPEPSHNISICGRSGRWDRRLGPGTQPPSPTVRERACGKELLRPASIVRGGCCRCSAIPKAR